MSQSNIQVLIIGGGLGGLISVEHQGIPLHQSLHDYEVEMLRYGFDAVRAFSQRGGPNRLFRSSR